MTTTPRLWKSQTQVNTTDADSQFDGQIAGLSDGGYVVVWTDRTLTLDDGAIFGQRYNSAGNKVGGEVPLTLSLPNANLPTGSRFAPAVTVLPNGAIAVAFVNQPDSNLNEAVYVRIFDPSLNLIRKISSTLHRTLPRTPSPPSLRSSAVTTSSPIPPATAAAPVSSAFKSASSGRRAPRSISTTPAPARRQISPSLRRCPMDASWPSMRRLAAILITISSLVSSAPRARWWLRQATSTFPEGPAVGVKHVPTWPHCEMAALSSCGRTRMTRMNRATRRLNSGIDPVQRRHRRYLQHLGQDHPGRCTLRERRRPARWRLPRHVGRPRRKSHPRPAVRCARSQDRQRVHGNRRQPCHIPVGR